jgi:PTS system nitrogen regulatory IIA component
LKLHGLLSNDLIIPDLRSASRDDVLKEMSGYLKRTGRIASDGELFKRLLQREMLGTTAIGDGVAIPHCKLDNVVSPVFLLAVSRTGARFDSLDGRPSHIFFLVVSSPDDPGLSLRILGAIARLVRGSASLARRLLDAPDPAAMIEVVREEEARLHG